MGIKNVEILLFIIWNLGNEGERYRGIERIYFRMISTHKIFLGR